MMSSVLQSPYELVPKFLKAWNAAVVNSFGGGSMDSPALRMQAASLVIQPSTPFLKGH